MDVIKRMEPVWLALVVVGALNWGARRVCSSSTSWTEIFGAGTVADVIYVIVGLAGADDGPAAVRGLPHRARTAPADGRLAARSSGPGVHTRSLRGRARVADPCATRPTI